MMTFRHTHIYVPATLGLWLGLFVDSNYIATKLMYNQWLASAIVVLTFFWVYSQVTKSIKLIMLYGLILGALGESFFSLVLGMYTYRLENIPLYVPPGHSIIFVGIYYLMKEPFVQKYQDLIIRVLFSLMIIYSSFWLLYFNDLFGFLCVLTIVWVLYHYPVNRLFFLLMFVMVACAENLGTLLQCWQYPSIWFNQFQWIPSASPPSGISIFYSAFDIGCLWCYKQLNRQSWNRMRSIQRTANQKLIQP